MYTVINVQSLIKKYLFKEKETRSKTEIKMNSIYNNELKKITISEIKCIEATII